MDLVLVNPALSLFQESLIDGVRRGLLSDRDVERIKEEGAALVQKTAERFFPSAAHQATYLYAVRMVDVILSFALAQTERERGATHLSTPLNEVLRIGLQLVKEMADMGNRYWAPEFPRRPSELEAMPLQNLALEVTKNKYSPGERVHALLNEREAYRERKRLADLTEFLVRMRHGANYQAAVEEEFGVEHDPNSPKSQGLCEHMINSHLFSTALELDTGYRLTPTIAEKAADKKRPTLIQVRERLMKHRAVIRADLQTEYDGAVERFLGAKEIKQFFESPRRGASRLVHGPSAILYCWRIFSTK